MIPVAFSNFFLAMAGAGAGLVGLLFVAISINPTRILGAEGQPEHQVMAESTFTGLVNGFFVSCAALIPVGGIGNAGMVFAALGLVATARLTIGLTRARLLASPSRMAGVLHIVRIYLLTLSGLQPGDSWFIERACTPALRQETCSGTALPKRSPSSEDHGPFPSARRYGS